MLERLEARVTVACIVALAAVPALAGPPASARSLLDGLGGPLHDPPGCPLRGWWVAETAHVRLVGPGRPDALFRLAWDLEQKRAALTGFLHAPLDTGGATQLVVLPPEDYQALGVAGTGGLYVGVLDFFRMPVVAWGGSLEKSLTHEYTHHLVGSRAWHTPRWLHEGLAQYLERVEIVSDSGGTYGRIAGQRRAATDGAEEERAGVAELFAWTTGNEAPRYVAAEQVVEALLRSRRPGFDAFWARVVDGAAWRDAWREALPDLAPEAVEALVSTPPEPGAPEDVERVPIPAAAVREPRLHRLAHAEAHAVLATVTRIYGPPSALDRVVPELRRALTLDPGSRTRCGCSGSSCLRSSPRPRASRSGALRRSGGAWRGASTRGCRTSRRRCRAPSPKGRPGWPSRRARSTCSTSSGGCWRAWT